MFLEGEDIEAWLENQWPVTIICDRFSGAYSNGLYWAMPVLHDQIPEDPFVDGSVADEFWVRVDNNEVWPVGAGATPNDAVLDLIRAVEEGRNAAHTDLDVTCFIGGLKATTLEFDLPGTTEIWSVDDAEGNGFRKVSGLPCVRYIRADAKYHTEEVLSLDDYLDMIEEYPEEEANWKRVIVL